MVLKKVLAVEAAVANWYKHFVPAFAREVLEEIYFWATKNAERYEQFQNSITFMMLLFFTSRKILLGMVGLVWVALSFLVGSVWAAFYILAGSIWAAISFVVGLIWAAFSILVGSIWAAISFVVGLIRAAFSILVGWAAISFEVGLIWAAVPFLLGSALIFYVVFFIWRDHAQHALFLIKKKEFAFAGTAACLGLLLLYRSASFSLLDTVYLIIMETLVISLIYLMIKERIPEGYQSKTFWGSYDPSNYHEIFYRSVFFEPFSFLKDLYLRLCDSHIVLNEANLQCTSSRVFKLNTDGNNKRSSEGNLSAGGVLRDSDGKWFKGFIANFGSGVVIEFEAELLGLLYGLQLARHNDIRILEVECDSKAVVDLIVNSILESHPLYDLHLNCKKLIFGDWNCSIRHIHREQNKVADNLANLGHDVGLGIHPLDHPPPSVLSLIEADRCC